MTFSEWMAGQDFEEKAKRQLLKATKDTELWRTMIVNVMKGHDT